MGIEGLSAIGQRVAEIRSLVADPALALSGATTGTSSASSASTTFASALAEALAADGTTSGGSDALSTDGSSLLDALGLSGSSPADSPGSSSTDLLGSSSADLLGSLSGLSGGSSGLTASLLQALGLSGSSGSSTSLSALSGLGLSGTALLADSPATREALRELRAAGVQLSLDDFGTGYSSLRSLRAFPVDKIKIDRSFVGDIGRKADSAAIIRAVIALAHDLGLKTAAEGIETEGQLQWLALQRCTEGQGHFISEPLPADEIRTLLETVEAIPLTPPQGRTQTG